MNARSDSKMPMASDGPIGIFDSGIGGLSVLRHIQTDLPHEHLLYFADTGFAPYGSKPEAVIVERSLWIADYLIQRGAKALVVACNTATAASIHALRTRHPSLPVVGVEPGLKPAAALSKTQTVGVLATERTLASAKFNQLREQISAATNVRFLLQACIGLSDQVEKGELQSAATSAMLQQYVAPLLLQGADTLVLGCTHYPFVQPLIEQIAQNCTKNPVAIVDTGAAVARQLKRLLQEHALQRLAEGTGTLETYTTGQATDLTHAFANLLQLHPSVTQISPQS